MTAAENMRGVLRGTGLYTLAVGDPADWEIAALDAGFSIVEGEIAALGKDLAAATATAYQLDEWEKLFRPMPSTEEEETRRRMAVSRLACRPCALTLSALTAGLPGCGVQGTVTEGEGVLTLQVEKYLGVTEKEALAELELLMPAHIPWETAAATG